MRNVRVSYSNLKLLYSVVSCVSTTVVSSVVVVEELPLPDPDPDPLPVPEVVVTGFPLESVAVDVVIGFPLESVAGELLLPDPEPGVEPEPEPGVEPEPEPGVEPEPEPAVVGTAGVVGKRILFTSPTTVDSSPATFWGTCAQATRGRAQRQTSTNFMI